MDKACVNKSKTNAVKFWFKLRWWRWLAWLDAHTPVMCGSCGKVLFKQDSLTELTLMGVLARLCKPCHREYFEPFSE